MSDYETLFGFWTEPKTSLTLWRQYIETMLGDEIRALNFIETAKAHKRTSPLHRAFYLRLRFDQIGLQTIDNAKCLAQLEQCLAQMPDHPSIQESVARLLVGIYTSTRKWFQRKSSKMKRYDLERARKLFSCAAFEGHKSAIRHLATTKLITGEPEYLWSMFDHLAVDQETDPFFTLWINLHKMGEIDIAATNMVDAIIAVDMPLNHAVMHSIALTFAYMERLLDKRISDPSGDFIRLFTYIEPHLQIKRTLPKNRDPFRIYTDELSAPVAQIFKDAATVYQSLVTDPGVV